MSISLKQRDAGPLSFEELVKRHRGELLAYLVRLLSNLDDAEDACQDTLLRAHGAFHRLDAAANARAWLFRIATRSAFNASRGRKRRATGRVDVDMDLLPAAATVDPDRRERLGRVVRAVNALPRRQRAALMQRRFHGLSYDEIAASLGGTATAARANVYQAVKKLRAALGDDAPDAENERSQ